MGWPAAIGAAALGIASAGAKGGIGSALQHQSSKSLMEHQLHLNTTGAVEKLRAAGLNPLLAVSGKWPGVGIGTSGTNLPDGIDITQSAKNLQDVDLKRAQEQTEAKKQRNIAKDTALKAAQYGMIHEKTRKVGREIQQIWVNMEKVMLEMEKLANESKEIIWRTGVHQMEMHKSQAIIDELKAKVPYLDVQTNTLMRLLTEIEQTSDAYKGTKGKVLKQIKLWREALGVDFTAIAAPGIKGIGGR
jgi:hypothetical protein